MSVREVSSAGWPCLVLPSPRTPTVEVNTSRSQPAAAAASSTLSVPPTFTS